MLSAKEIESTIDQFIGTTKYHQFSPIPGYPVATDGAIYVAESAECFWLLDIIGSYHDHKKVDKDLSVWKLTVNDDSSATVRGYNDVELTIEQKIEYTDFPLRYMEMWLIRGVILLPSEY